MVKTMPQMQQGEALRLIRYFACFCVIVVGFILMGGGARIAGGDLGAASTAKGLLVSTLNLELAVGSYAIVRRLPFERPDRRRACIGRALSKLPDSRTAPASWPTVVVITGESFVPVIVIVTTSRCRPEVVGHRRGERLRHRLPFLQRLRVGVALSSV